MAWGPVPISQVLGATRSSREDLWTGGVAPSHLPILGRVGEQQLDGMVTNSPCGEKHHSSTQLKKAHIYIHIPFPPLPFFPLLNFLTFNLSLRAAGFPWKTTGML